MVRWYCVEALGFKQQGWGQHTVEPCISTSDIDILDHIIFCDGGGDILCIVAHLAASQATGQ